MTPSRNLRLAAFLAFVAPLGLTPLGIAGAAQARTLEVGPGKEYKQPSDAAQAAKSGDKILIQPGEYFDCATIRTNKLVMEGVGDADKVILTDKTCGGKGILVITGQDVTIRNLTLTRARVPDGNGAGIRNESPDLTVDGVRFVNNQNGILSTPSDPGTLTILNSLFDRNGTCANGGGCAHGLYVGTLSNLLHIERTTFIGTKQGHHIKARTLRTEIIGCTVRDGEEGTASYLIEQPQGGSLVVRDSTLQKGPEAENHSAAIVVGSEGVTMPTREITIENNTFRNDGGWNTIFVRNLTATDAMLRNNRISGQVKPLEGDGKVTPGR